MSNKEWKVGDTFVVDIQNADQYSLDGVENGNLGVITEKDNMSVNDYWANIETPTGMVEGFLLSAEDMKEHVEETGSTIVVPGSIVRLKSGGEPMTVYKTTTDHVSVMWFNNGSLAEAVIPKVCVKKY